MSRTCPRPGLSVLDDRHVGLSFAPPPPHIAVQAVATFTPMYPKPQCNLFSFPWSPANSSIDPLSSAVFFSSFFPYTPRESPTATFTGPYYFSDSIFAVGFPPFFFATRPLVCEPKCFPPTTTSFEPAPTCVYPPHLPPPPPLPPPPISF